MSLLHIDLVFGCSPALLRYFILEHLAISQYINTRTILLIEGCDIAKQCIITIRLPHTHISAQNIPDTDNIMEGKDLWQRVHRKDLNKKSIELPVLHTY